MGRGLLVAAFDFSTAHADEFHDWYDLEHVPEREAVPGVGACERWIGEEHPALSVATYDLDSADVLRSKPYAAIAYGNLSVWSKRVTAMCKRLLRFEGTQIAPGAAAGPRGAGGGEARCRKARRRDPVDRRGAPALPRPHPHRAAPLRSRRLSIRSPPAIWFGARVTAGRALPCANSRSRLP